MFLATINETLVKYGDFAVWLPTIFVASIIITRVLKGMRRGFRKSIILTINGIIALACAIGVYFFIFNNTTSTVIFVNERMGDFGLKSIEQYLNVSNASGNLTAMFSEYMYNNLAKDYGTIDQLSPLYANLIAYSTAWAISVVKLIFVLVMFIVYLVVKFILYIVYLIFFKEGRRKNRIRKLHAVNRGPAYNRHAGLGSLVGLGRGIVWSIVFLSFFGSFAYIVTNGNYEEASRVDTSTDDGIQFGENTEDNIKMSYIYNIFQRYGNTGVGKIAESLTNSENTPYYLMIADTLTKVKVSDYSNENVVAYTPDVEIQFRNLFGPFGYIAFNSALTLSKYGFDTTKINDDNYMAEFFNNEEMQVEVDQFIDQINHTDYWDSFVKVGLDTAVQLYVNRDTGNEEKAYFETLFIGEDAITPSDIITKDDYNIIYKLAFKSMAMYQPARQISSLNGGNLNETTKILYKSTDNIEELMNDLFSLSIFTEDSKSNEIANTICINLMHTVLDNLEPTFSVNNIKSDLIDSSKIDYLSEVKNIKDVIAPALKIANSLAINGQLTNLDDIVSVLNIFNSENKESFDSISNTIGNSSLLGYFLNAKGFEDTLNKSVESTSLFYKEQTFIIPDNINWTNESGNTGELSKTINALFYLASALNDAGITKESFDELGDTNIPIGDKTSIIDNFADALNSTGDDFAGTVLDQIAESKFVHNILSDTLLGIEIPLGEMNLRIVLSDNNMYQEEINSLGATKDLIKTSEISNCLTSLTNATTLLEGFDGSDYSTIITNIQDNPQTIDSLMESEILRNSFSSIIFDQLNNLDVSGINIEIPSDYDISDPDSVNYKDNLVNWGGQMDDDGNVTSDGEISKIMNILTKTDIGNAFFTTDGSDLDTGTMIDGILDTTRVPINVQTIFSSNLMNVLITSALTSEELLSSSNYSIVIPAVSLVENNALIYEQQHSTLNFNKKYSLSSNVSLKTLNDSKMLKIQDAKDLFKVIPSVISVESGEVSFKLDLLTSNDAAGATFRTNLSKSKILSTTIASAIINLTSDPSFGDLGDVFNFPSDYADISALETNTTAYGLSPWFSTTVLDNKTDFSKLLDSLIALKLTFANSADGSVAVLMNGSNDLNTDTVLDTVLNLDDTRIETLFECNIINISLTSYLTKDDLLGADSKIQIVIPDVSLSQLSVTTAGQDENFVEPSSNFAKLNTSDVKALFKAIKPILFIDTGFGTSELSKDSSGEISPNVNILFDNTQDGIDFRADLLDSPILSSTIIKMLVDMITSDDADVTLKDNITIPSDFRDMVSLSSDYNSSPWISTINNSSSEFDMLLKGLATLNIGFDGTTPVFGDGTEEPADAIMNTIFTMPDSDVEKLFSSKIMNISMTKKISDPTLLGDNSDFELVIPNIAYRAFTATKEANNSIDNLDSDEYLQMKPSSMQELIKALDPILLETNISGDKVVIKDNAGEYAPNVQIVFSDINYRNDKLYNSSILTATMITMFDNMSKPGKALDGTISVPSDYSTEELRKDYLTSNWLAVDMSQSEFAKLLDGLNELDINLSDLTSPTFGSSPTGNISTDLINVLVDLNNAQITNMFNSLILNISITNKLQDPSVMGNSSFTIIIPNDTLIAKVSDNDDNLKSSGEYDRLQVSVAENLFAALGDLISTDVNGNIVPKTEKIFIKDDATHTTQATVTNSKILSASVIKMLIDMANENGADNIIAVPSEYNNLVDIKENFGTTNWYTEGELLKILVACSDIELTIENGSDVSYNETNLLTNVNTKGDEIFSSKVIGATIGKVLFDQTDKVSALVIPDSSIETDYTLEGLVNYSYVKESDARTLIYFLVDSIDGLGVTDINDMQNSFTVENLLNDVTKLQKMLHSKIIDASAAYQIYDKLQTVQISDVNLIVPEILLDSGSIDLSKWMTTFESSTNVIKKDEAISVNGEGETYKMLSALDALDLVDTISGRAGASFSPSKFFELDNAEIDTVLLSDVLNSTMISSIIGMTSSGASLDGTLILPYKLNINDSDLISNYPNTNWQSSTSSEVKSLIIGVKETSFDYNNPSAFDSSIINTLDEVSTSDSNQTKLNVMLNSSILQSTLSSQIVNFIDVPAQAMDTVDFVASDNTITASELHSIVYGLLQIDIADYSNVEISLTMLSSLTGLYIKSSADPMLYTAEDNSNALRSRIDVIYDSITLRKELFSKVNLASSIYVPLYTTEESNGTTFIKLAEMTRLLDALGGTETANGLGLDINDLGNIDINSLIGSDLERKKLLRSQIIEATVATIIEKNLLTLNIQAGYAFDHNNTAPSLANDNILANWISERDQFEEITSGKELLNMLASVSNLGIDPKQADSVDANTVINKTEGELQIILSSDIIYKAISDKIDGLDDSIIKVPSATPINNDDFTLKEDLFTAIEKQEILDLFAGIDSLDIADINTINIDSLSITKLKDAVPSIVESWILWNKVSSSITSNADLYVYSTAIQVEAGDAYITSLELTELFSGITKFGVTDLSNANNIAIGNNLTSANIDDALMSIILEGTIARKIYDGVKTLDMQDDLKMDNPTQENTNMVNWLTSRGASLYDESGFTSKELRNIITSLNELGITLGENADPSADNIFPNGFETKTEYTQRINKVLGSDIVYKAISNNIYEALASTVPAALPYYEDEFVISQVGFRAIEKQEIPDLLYGLSSMGLSSIGADLSNSIGSIDISNVSAVNVVPSIILWNKVSENIENSLTVVDIAKDNIYSIVDPGTTYIESNEIDNLFSGLSELGITNITSISTDVLGTNDLNATSTSAAPNTKLQVILDSNILWNKVSTVINNNGAIIVPINHVSTTLNDIASVEFEDAFNHTYIQKYELEAFIKASGGDASGSAPIDIATLKGNIVDFVASIIMRTTITNKIKTSNGSLLAGTTTFDPLASDAGSLNITGGTEARALNANELTELVNGLDVLGVNDLDNISFNVQTLTTLSDAEITSLYLDEFETNGSTILTNMIYEKIQETVTANPAMNDSTSVYYNMFTRTLNYNAAEASTSIYTEATLMEKITQLRSLPI